MHVGLRCRKREGDEDAECGYRRVGGDRCAPTFAVHNTPKTFLPHPGCFTQRLCTRQVVFQIEKCVIRIFIYFTFTLRVLCSGHLAVP